MKLTSLIAFCLVISGVVYSQSYCIPHALNHIPYYNIFSFQIDTFFQASPGTSTLDYEDFTATPFIINEKYNIPVSIQKNPSITYVNIGIWLDSNNDGTFQHPQEMVFQFIREPGVPSPLYINGIMSFPDSILFNDTLRLRVRLSNSPSGLLPCVITTYGQIEDYSVIIIPANQPPVAGFSVSNISTCNRNVTFSADSTGSPVHYFWDFGDGNTSSLPLYTHTYEQDGIYTISLAVSNSQGTDILTMQDYVEIEYTPAVCDTFAIPLTGSTSVTRACDFVITDDGKANNYSNLSDGYISISLIGEDDVCLHFLEFDFEQEHDFLEIYYGPTPEGILMGRYTGNELPPDICAYNSTICLRQYSNDIINSSGFLAVPICSMSISENGEANPISVYPNPFTENFIMDLSKITSGDISLVSMTGQIVYRERIEVSGQHIISLHNLSSGIYIIRLASEAYAWQQKIIKL